MEQGDETKEQRARRDRQIVELTEASEAEERVVPSRIGALGPPRRWLANERHQIAGLVAERSRDARRPVLGDLTDYLPPRTIVLRSALGVL